MRQAVILIGAGGIGGHVAAALARQRDVFTLIVDGDKVSPSNLDRQFFTESDIDWPKVACFSRSGLGNGHVPEYLSDDRDQQDRLVALLPLADSYALYGAVDNMPARRTIVEMAQRLWVDHHKPFTVVLAGNEVDDAEALAWRPDFNIQHPYSLVPELRTSMEGHDPLRSCTAGVHADQTYLANLTAAVLGLQLLKFWSESVPAALPHLQPHERGHLLRTSPARLTCHGVRIRAYPESQTHGNTNIALPD